MTEKIELIVLSSTKFGENSLVLHTLSREYGRRSFLVQAGKRSVMSMFMPLCILEGEVIKNSKSELWRLRNLSAKAALYGIRGNIHKNTITLFMSEVIYRSVTEGLGGEDLFDWCEKEILTLDALQSDFSNFHIRFLIELAGALGFVPSYENVLPFAGQHAGTVRKFIESDFGTSMLIPLNGDGRSEICSSLLKYLEFHTESTLNIRSLKVLHELYR